MCADEAARAPCGRKQLPNKLQAVVYHTLQTASWGFESGMHWDALQVMLKGQTV